MHDAQSSPATLSGAPTGGCGGDCERGSCRAAEAAPEPRSRTATALMALAERFAFPALLLPSLG